MRFVLALSLTHFLHHANALLGSFPAVSRPILSYHTLKTYRRARSIAIFEDDDFSGQTGQWPYSDADLGRVDSSDDSRFYDTPRLVTHIDNQAISSLTSVPTPLSMIRIFLLGVAHCIFGSIVLR